MPSVLACCIMEAWLAVCMAAAATLLTSAALRAVYSSLDCACSAWPVTRSTALRCVRASTMAGKSWMPLPIWKLLLSICCAPPMSPSTSEMGPRMLRIWQTSCWLESCPWAMRRASESMDFVPSCTPRRCLMSPPERRLRALSCRLVTSPGEGSSAWLACFPSTSTACCRAAELPAESHDRAAWQDTRLAHCWEGGSVLAARKHLAASSKALMLWQ
mmetsp:Transcript_32135/g.91161  ORF Transcript_32135/g.91161 Transcript_32135/m.91161 type:complete len:216 (-) Transcript_32135:1349-1996(-)